MDLKLIKKLIRLMHRAELQEIEVEEGGKRVRLRRAESGGPGRMELAQVPRAPESTKQPAASLEAGVVEFRSPLVGTFFRSSSPEAEPFVSRGSKVSPDTVLCIVEAMKVMNEIKAETQGEIVDILVKNGEPVEFGKPLFLIRPR